MGMFWQDAAKERGAGRSTGARVIPPIPETSWTTPSHNELPNLSAAKAISVDLETRDDDLTSKGPGVRRDGYICGVAIGTDDGYRQYFPIRHEMGNNMDPGIVMEWCKDELTRANQPKVGANLMYDLDYLYEAGVQVAGPFYDVQVAEPLIDENLRLYNLDSLGQRYCGEGKDSDEMYMWLAQAFGGPATRRSQAGNIWRADPRVVAPYAISDVDLPFRILEKQELIIQQQNLQEVWDMETRLIPMLLAMRRRGVAVDSQAAVELDGRLMQFAADLRAKLKYNGIEPNEKDTIARYCDKAGIRYPVTAKGNPSFQKGWLQNHMDENLKMITEVRTLEKHSGTFLQGAIMSHAVNGRIHTEFNQLKSDSYGTVSGRFSSSNPNLQNIPRRDKKWGPLIRAMFVPDEGESWYSDDWSQIEYRLLVHYARGEGDEKTREQYRKDPKTDFHKFVADISGIDRDPAKSINFGLVYGMGEPTMAAGLGRPLDEVKPIFEQYHETFPFVKTTYNAVAAAAAARGYIRTILGRRRRFVHWEPRDWEASKARRDEGLAPLTREQALDEYGIGRIKRAMTHKALNGLLQGGAADLMKKAMVLIWERGICNYLKAPLLTVHDELNWSVPGTKEALQAHDEAVRIMETCHKLRVPLICDSGKGKNWGEAH